MRHKHVGPLHVACTGCFDEVKENESIERRETARREARARRFWASAIVVFLLALALVCALALFGVGMRR